CLSQSAISLRVRFGRDHQSSSKPSGLLAKLRRIKLRFVQSIDRLAVFHKFQLVPRDHTDEFRISFDQHLLALIASEQHPLLLDLLLKRINPLHLRFSIGDFRQKRIRDRHRSTKDDQRQDDLIEGMPDSPSMARGLEITGREYAHLATHLTAVDGVVTKFFFYYYP